MTPPDLDEVRRRFERSREALEALLRDLPEAAWRWRPPDGGWSILEIICHLLDEEREDFRARLDRILHHPALDFDPIDPEGWAIERGYAEQDPAEALAQFTAERGVSLAWLDALRDADWSAEKTHPRFGSITAREMLASWLAHDYLHLRQIVRRLHDQTTLLIPCAGTGYAGSW